MNGLYNSNGSLLPFAEMNQGTFARMIASRDTFAQNFGNILGYLPDPDLILQRTGNDITVYRQILQDAHVYSCTEQRKAEVLSMEWEIARMKAGEKAVNFIEDFLADDDKIVGFIAATVSECLHTKKDKLVVEITYVSPDYRDYGVAKDLIDF